MLPLLLSAAVVVFSLLSDQQTVWLSSRIEADLIQRSFGRVLSLPLAFFGVHRTGDLISRATSDIEAARMAVGPAVMWLLDAILSFGIAFTVMRRSLSSSARLSVSFWTPAFEAVYAPMPAPARAAEPRAGRGH